MSFSPVPQYSFRDVTQVTPVFLERLGVKFLMLDLDNTIAAYGEHSLSDITSQWADEIKENGAKLYLVSNSRRKGRVELFAGALGADYVMRASKPSPKGVLQAMDSAGFRTCESAFIGDQVFTDTLAANRAGVISIIVRPRRLQNPFLAFRYCLETPFRALCKKKIGD